MFKKRETEVLVVGSGPVGMLAALSLVDRGLDVQIVDKAWRGSIHSYALALHSDSLRILDRLGLLAGLQDKGYRVERIGLYLDHDRSGELDLTLLPGDYPYILVIPQSELEQVLQSALKQRKIKIQWNHKTTGIDSGPDGVRVHLAKMDKISSGYPIARTDWIVEKTFDVTAQFVIGADGYHSSVRSCLGLDFPLLGAPQIFSVFEFPGRTYLGHESRIVLGRQGLDVYWPLGPERARWSFQISEEDEKTPTVEILQALLAERAPWFQPQPSEIHWSTLTLFDQRLVERFGEGRVWLAGDAAHITGPAGVQSMNVGLREADDLAAGIQAVTRDGASTDLFEEYGKRQHAEWTRLLARDGGIRSVDTESAWGGDRAIQILPCLPASGVALQVLMAQIGLEFE